MGLILQFFKLRSGGPARDMYCPLPFPLFLIIKNIYFLPNNIWWGIIIFLSLEINIKVSCM